VSRHPAAALVQIAKAAAIPRARADRRARRAASTMTMLAITSALPLSPKSALQTNCAPGAAENHAMTVERGTRYGALNAHGSGMVAPNPMDDTRDHDEPNTIRVEDQDPAHWKADGWAARIIKNEDDDGWAVEMTRDGELEPALVGPWTMGRDKKNPKPLDTMAFRTLVRAANEVRARHVQQLNAKLHRSVTVTVDSGERIRVDLDIVPDEDDPHAVLTIFDAAGAVASRTTVAADFKLTSDSAQRWLEGQRP
jgi:hypothetical protein